MWYYLVLLTSGTVLEYSKHRAKNKCKIILDIQRLYTYISNVAGGVGNTHTTKGEQHATQDPHQASDQR